MSPTIWRLSERHGTTDTPRTRSDLPGCLWLIYYSVERIEPSRTLMEPVWERASTGQISVVTGELSVIQTIVKPLRDGDETVQELFRDLLNSRGVRLEAPMHTLWEAAAAIRGAINL